MYGPDDAEMIDFEVPAVGLVIAIGHPRNQSLGLPWRRQSRTMEYATMS